MSDEKISREIWKKNLTTVKPNNNFKFCELSISFFRRIEVECLVKLTPTCFWNLKTSQWLDKLYNFDEWNIKMIATGFWSTSAKKIHYLFRFVSFFFLIVFSGIFSNFLIGRWNLGPILSVASISKIHLTSDTRDFTRVILTAQFHQWEWNWKFRRECILVLTECHIRD